MRKKKESPKKAFFTFLTRVITVLLLFVVLTPKPVEAATISVNNPSTNRIYFGKYWQNDTNGDGIVNTSDSKEPIMWRVLSVSGNKALLLADQNLDAQQYHSLQEDVNWADCDLRIWLNGTFYKTAFSDTERQCIQESAIVTKGDNLLGTKDVTTKDKVYIPSLDDVLNQQYGFASCDATATDYTRLATNTNYTATKDGMYAGGEVDVYWLRNVGQYSCIMTVLSEGICGYHTPPDVACGVRPMLELDISDTNVWSFVGSKPDSGNSEETELKDDIKLTVSGQLNYDYAYEVLDIINETRAAAGVNKLTMDKQLLETAMQRAAEVAISFSHERPNGQRCYSLFRTAAGGENIAMGQSSPETVMKSWNNSAGHYANIIRSNFTSVGVGCFVDSNGTCYWVQCFDSLSATDPYESGIETVSYDIPVKESFISLCSAGIYEIECNDKVKQVQMKVWNSSSRIAELSTCNFKYSSNNTSVADVDANGVIMVKKAGTAIITASLKGNTSIKVEKTVTKYEHSYTSKVVKSTYTEQGYTRHTCSRCGDWYDDNYTPVLEQPDSNQPSTEQPDNDQPSENPPDGEQSNTEQPAVVDDLPSVGTMKELSTGVYKITKSSIREKEVAYVNPKSKNKTSITIPGTINIDGYTYKVTEISLKAFKNNTKLKSVTIGKNVKKIGQEAFSGCKKLKKITIKSMVLKSVGNNAIKNIDKKATIVVPKKQLSKYKKLFTSKTGYKKTMKIKK